MKRSHRVGIKERYNLDEYFVGISDFYDEENRNSASVCYQEFSGSGLENVKQLTEIVGKHVCEKDYLMKKMEKLSITMVIE